MKKQQAIAILRQTKTNYNTIAKDWETTRAKPSDLKIKLLQKIKPNFKVLDFGCGNGLMVPTVLKKQANYLGIDISKELINLAKKKYFLEIKTGQVKFYVRDVLKNKLPKNEFDFIFSFAVLHHIPSKELQLIFLKEIFRLLKPKGEAVIVNWNLLNEKLAKKYSVLEQLKNPVSNWEKGDLSIPWKATLNKKINRYIHIFSKKELKELAILAGFKKTCISYYNQNGDRLKNGEEQVLFLKKTA